MDGDYGKVTEVRYYGAQCAAFTLQDCLNAKELEEQLKQKFYQSISDLCHPNVLKFLGLCHSDSSKLMLVTEMVDETLTSLVESQLNVPLHVKLSMLKDVSRGLWYLHSHNPSIVHGRLSCNSIFLTDQLEAKIAILRLDGGSTLKSKAQEALQDTLAECVPIDVFSYGGVILHVVNQELPKPLHDSEAYQNPKIIPELKNQGYLSTIAGLEVALLPLVEACLSGDPTMRPTMESVCSKIDDICEPFTGIDNVLWRLDPAGDPTITAGRKRISEVVQMASDIHKAHQRVVEQDQVITSLRVWLINLCCTVIIQYIHHIIVMHQYCISDLYI